MGPKTPANTEVLSKLNRADPGEVTLDFTSALRNYDGYHRVDSKGGFHTSLHVTDWVVYHLLSSPTTSENQVNLLDIVQIKMLFQIFACAGGRAAGLKRVGGSRLKFPVQWPSGERRVGPPRN